MASDTERLAFTTPEYRGFVLSAYYNDTANAHIEIVRDGKPWRTYQYPAYRIWNLSAHFTDMVDSTLNEEDAAMKEGK